MANTPEEAHLTNGDMAGSEEALIAPARPTGGSNNRPLKVAGLTALACLLLACQVFTVYTIFDQKQHIGALEKNSEQVRRQLSRPPMDGFQPKARLPISPLLLDIIPDDVETISPTPIAPMTTLQDTMDRLGEQLKDLIPDSQVPQFNETFLAHLQGLKHEMEEKDWQGFESWMRYWLILQMAQQQPQSPDPASSIKTKCQMDTTPGPKTFGSYNPQCDEQGHYKPMQCSHSTGYCWCVDENGTAIEGTLVRGRPDCQRGQAPGRSRMLQDLLAGYAGLDDE